MLSAACRYRPCTLRALFAVIKTADDEAMYRFYTADMLFILARGKLKRYVPLKRLCEMQMKNRPASVDRRNENEIAQHVVERLRGKEVRK